MSEMDTIQEFTNTITVPGAPDIPGLRFRGYRDKTDFEKMVAVIQGCKLVDQMERSDTAQDIERNYRYAPNFDITKDILYVEMGGEVIGYYRVMWYCEDHGDAIYTHFGFLVPEWRGQGIGRSVTKLHPGNCCYTSNGTAKVLPILRR
jgi:GNAT superfamily N-acetyltransferase